jgi:tetraacyldisaccharide-1-P 4'-kinase
MAEELNIKRCWFHKDHYDVPKKRLTEINERCIIVSSKDIVRIIKGQYDIS